MAGQQNKENKMTDEAKALTYEELDAKLKEAGQKGDWKAVRQYAKELDDMEKAKAVAEKEAKQKALADITIKVKGKIDAFVQKLIDTKELDMADGVWYSNDFGTTDTACRLMKTAPRKSGGGNGGGSYISHPAKTADLLAEVGANVIFKEATDVTIDKVSHTMPAGMTFKEAYDFSNNGGWRNRIRMALLKEAGLVS